LTGRTEWEELGTKNFEGGRKDYTKGGGIHLGGRLLVRTVDKENPEKKAEVRACFCVSGEKNLSRGRGFPGKILGGGERGKHRKGVWVSLLLEQGLSMGGGEPMKEGKGDNGKKNPKKGTKSKITTLGRFFWGTIGGGGFF